MSKILNPTWKYTPSHATDIRKTLDRARRDLKRQEEERAASSAKVREMPGIRKKS